jgi:alpha-N-acetylglucosamine transferase
MVRSYGFESNDIFFFESVVTEKHKNNRQLYTLDKIHALNIPEGLRVCLMDADIKVIRNIDHYLDFIHGSAYMNSTYNQDGMNGGVLIFERNEEEYKKALELAKDCQNDEEVWLKLYPNFHLEYIKHIPVGDWRDNPD